MSKRKRKLKTITIHAATFPNIGLGKDEEGREYRVKGAIKGSTVLVSPGRRRNGYHEAKIVELLQPSPMIEERGCMHRGDCGGCTYQGLTLGDENQYKEEQIRALMTSESIVLPDWEMVASPVAKGYRNKMEYTFGDEYKDGPLSLGLHKRGRYHDILSTPYCLLVHQDMNLLREGVMAFAKASGLPHYHRMKHEGYYRHAVIRRSATTGDLLLNLVTTSQGILNREELVNKLLEIPLEGAIRGILHTTNDALSDAIIPEKVDIIYGEDLIKETIHGIDFRLSAYAFFQTNTKGAEVLYDIVRDYAGEKNHDLILDLYSGTGTMAQLMAPMAKSVIGVEINEDAVVRAKESAERNGLQQVQFIAGDVKEVVNSLEGQASLAIVDPPREGLHPKALKWLSQAGIPSIIMVSCNPKTLARDLKGLLVAGYRTTRFTGLNQFPRTAHVETVVLMSRK